MILNWENPLQNIGDSIYLKGVNSRAKNIDYYCNKFGLKKEEIKFQKKENKIPDTVFPSFPKHMSQNDLASC